MDRVQTVSLMAATIYAPDKGMSYTDAVDHALALYADSEWQVKKAYGITSKELPECSMSGHICTDLECPRHG